MDLPMAYDVYPKRNKGSQNKYHLAVNIFHTRPSMSRASRAVPGSSRRSLHVWSIWIQRVATGRGLCLPHRPPIPGP